MTASPDITFSAIVPAFNRGRWVAEAVKSALAQGRRDMEIIVVDDGSTDDTAQILRQFGDEIVVVSQENSGVSVARNSGIERACGKWIVFLDADDRWRPGHIDRLEKAARDNPIAGLIFFDAMVIDGEGVERKKRVCPDPGPDPFVSLLLANTITTSACAIKRECFETSGLFLPGLKSGQDWDVWLRVADRFPVVHIPRISVDYRKQESGTVHTRGRGTGMRDDNLFIVSRAVALRPDLDEGVIRVARSNCYYESAVRLMAGGNTSDARAELVSAVKEYPYRPVYWALLMLSLGGPSAAEFVINARRGLERP